MSDKIKILMIDPWIGNDYSIFLCSNLHNQNVDVSLLVNEDRDVSVDGFRIIKKLPSKNKSFSKTGKLFKYISYLFMLYKYVCKKEYNIIHVQAFRRRRVEALFFYLLSLTKIKLVYTVHDVDPLDWSSTDRFLNRLIYRSADSLLTHSETNKNVLLNNYNVNKGKVSIVPHGSFENSHPGKAFSREDSRSILNIDMHHNVLLFFGAVKEYKGIDLLIRAASRASETVKDLVLIIAGKGEGELLEQEYLRKIKSLNSNLKVITHFRFIENEEVQMYFEASDIVVLPYRLITHSGVLHVAYSYGKAVIASRTGDFEEFVKVGATGFLFNIDDEQALTGTIIRAFSSKEKLKQMGNCAKEINRRQFSWSNSAVKLKQVYQNLSWRSNE